MPLCFLNSTIVLSAEIDALKNLVRLQSIIQDEDDFIWLAGDHGITRYTGSNTINFANQSKQWQLPYTWIHDVSKANDNFLISTEANGLWLFSPRTGVSKKINIKASHDSFNNAVFFNNQYYAYNLPDKFYRYDPKTEQTHLLKDNIRIKQIVHTKNYVYVAEKNGLYRLINDKLQLVLKDSIKTVTPFEHGIIAISDNHIHYIDEKDQKLSIPVNDIIHASTREYQQDNFFIITAQGLIKKYNAKTLKELPHNYEKSKPTYAEQLLHDRSGALWVISSQGVSLLSPRIAKNHIRIFDVKTNAIDISVIKEKIILGSYGSGLHNFDLNNPIINEDINNKLTPDGLKSMDLLAIENNLYLATFDGLWNYNISNEKLYRVDFPNNNKLLLKLVNKDNILYIATNYHGFYIYDLHSNKIVSHINKQHGLSSPEIIDILPLGKDIWIASTKGVDIYHPETQTTTNLKLGNANKVISLIHYDNKIFASTKAGIFVFNTKGDLLSHFSKSTNFSKMTVIKNKIWVSAQHGLYIINPYDYRISMVPNTEKYTFTDAPILLKETVYVPHYGGVLEVPLQKQEMFNPKVLITKTIITGKAELLNKTIEVDSPNAVITLELASLDYRAGQEKKFKYRINNGIYIEINSNQITLTGLSSGMYYLEIMGTNSLGQWSDYKAFTEINVAYPWYWTVNMRLFYVIFSILTIITIIRLVTLRHQSLTKVHQVLSEELQSKGNIAIFLNRNLMIVSRLIKESKDHTVQHEEVETSLEKQQNHCLDKIEMIINTSLDEIQKNIYSQEPDALYGNDLLIGLPFMLKHLHKKHDVFITENIAITEHTLSPELQSDIYKIIYEALNAAIVNSEARYFTLAVRIFKNKFWITLTDDIDSFINFDSKVSFDMAMYYIRQIVKKHNASMNAFNSSDKGSQLVISIPLMDIS